MVPAFFPDWKRPPMALAALFEPNGRLNGDKALMAPDMLFNYSEDVIPVVIENSGHEPVTPMENPFAVGCYTLQLTQHWKAKAKYKTHLNQNSITPS